MHDKTVFNRVAVLYDKMRPDYPAALYADIFACKPITDTSSALEIGIGTGQATLPILGTGCTLTAVELGDSLSAFAAEKFRSYSNFSVITAPFPDVSLPDDSFDLIYSATAFHWIPEEAGYAKVFSLLKSGGVFARFSNHPAPAKYNEPLHTALQKIYAEDKTMPLHSPNSAKSPEEIAQIPLKYGFTDIKLHLYHRTRTFTSVEYTDLLLTYSDHNSRPPEFHAKIADAIDAHGGKINVFDTIDLQLARKP